MVAKNVENIGLADVRAIRDIGNRLLVEHQDGLV